MVIIIKYIGIFQGGGVKGIAHLGAIKALEERGFTCYKAAGTSMGAIIASLIISGYTSDELLDILLNIDLTKLKQKGKIKEIIKDKGYYSMDQLETFLTQLFKQKKINTFQDVKVGNEYRLKMITYDLLKRRQVIIPDDLPKYRIQKDTFRIVKGVMMSATYPLYYKPYHLNKQIMLDGALSNNFPINVFDSNELIIGFNIIGDRIKEPIKPNQYIIRIPVKGYKSLQFKLSVNQKKELFLKGYQAGRRFVHDFFK